MAEKKDIIAKEKAEVSKETKSYRRYDLTGDIKGMIYLPKDAPEKIKIIIKEA